MPTFPVDDLIRLRRKLERSLGREYVEMIVAVRDEHTIAELARLIERGELDLARATIRREAALFAADVNAGYAAAGAQAAPFAAEAIGVRVRFDSNAEPVVRAMRENRLRLVGGISRDTEDAVRVALTDGLERGINPREMARAYQDTIGLTESQARSVVNFRRLLTEDPAQAMTRALRDRRFDGKLRSGDLLSKTEINEMVDRYRIRYIRYRAEVIARTEALRATHEGNDATFMQLVDEGQLARDEVMYQWLATGDDRTRDSHWAMNGQKRSIGEPFESGDGNLILYPGDPRAPLSETAQCRCVRLIIVGRRKFWPVVGLVTPRLDLRAAA